MCIVRVIDYVARIVCQLSSLVKVYQLSYHRLRYCVSMLIIILLFVIVGLVVYVVLFIVLCSFV